VTLVESLTAFNRKERYWLIRNALGQRNEAILLSTEFRECFKKITGLSIPKNAWWALDYHIDWLIGALLVYAGHSLDDVGDNPQIAMHSGELQDRAIQGSQQDFDFVVAFDNVVILIEAKATGAWDNKQFESKCKRLNGLRALCTGELPEIYFVLMSPGAPSPLKAQDLPSDIKQLDPIPLWLDDVPTDFVGIKRDPSATGTQWKLFRQRKPPTREC